MTYPLTKQQGAEAILYEAVGMNNQEALEVADVLCGSAVWHNGHAYGNTAVIRPMGCKCLHCAPLSNAERTSNQNIDPDIAEVRAALSCWRQGTWSRAYAFEQFERLLQGFVDRGAVETAARVLGRQPEETSPKKLTDSEAASFDKALARSPRRVSEKSPGVLCDNKRLRAIETAVLRTNSRLAGDIEYCLAKINPATDIYAVLTQVMLDLRTPVETSSSLGQGVDATMSTAEPVRRSEAHSSVPGSIEEHLSWCGVFKGLRCNCHSYEIEKRLAEKASEQLYRLRPLCICCHDKTDDACPIHGSPDAAPPIQVVGPTCGKDTPDGPCRSDIGHAGDCDGLPY